MNPIRKFVRPVLCRVRWAGLLLSGLMTIPLYAGEAVTPHASAGQPSIHINLFEHGKPTLSYALVRQHDTVLFVGNHKELAQATRHKQTAAGDFLWVRKGQQFYLLDDTTVIGELLALWQQVTPFEQQMRELEQQMQQYTDQLEDRVAELEAAVAESDVATMRILEREIEPLQQQIEPIGQEMERVGEQIEALSETAHEQTVTAIEAAIVSGAAKALAAP